jgi:F0F1-type ATP synthase assembly protein I
VKSLFKLVKTVSVLGQFGFTLITPPVLMALLGWWLTRQFGFGVWVIALTLLLGLITAGASAWRFWKKYQTSAARKAQSDDSEDRPVVYYRHE